MKTDEDWEIVDSFPKLAMVAPKVENPITAVCVVSDKNRPPPGFQPITKAHDDPSQEADVWKDGFFAMSRVFRYICVCKTVPQNAFVCNVVADLAIVNEKDLVPPGFVALEYTEDTREKALRKKQLCIRSVSRESAVDAVSDIVILHRQKRPPQGYTLAGGMYPGLPYPVHPGTSSNGPAMGNLPPIQTVPLVQRSDSATSPSVRGVDGVPFELNPRLKASGNDAQSGWPSFREFTPLTMESEFSYSFRVEQQVVEQSLTSTP